MRSQTSLDTPVFPGSSHNDLSHVNTSDVSGITRSTRGQGHLSSNPGISYTTGLIHAVDISETNNQAHSAGLTGPVTKGMGLTGTLSSDIEDVEVGKFTFKPTKAKFVNDTLRNIQAYCKIKLGWHSEKGLVGRNQSDSVNWGDEIVLERKYNESYAKLEVKDKNKNMFNDRIGEAQIDLKEIRNQGSTFQWYELKKGDKVVGEILVDIDYERLSKYKDVNK